MLFHTFCHLPGISLERERVLWAAGITTWDDFEQSLVPQLALFGEISDSKSKLARELDRSRKALESKDGAYFAANLPPQERYRIVCGFPDDTVFLDIETTGLSRYYDYITLIGASKKADFKVFVRGTDHQDLIEMLASAAAMVTFNGALFDLPFIKEHMPDIKVPIAHTDLRFLARRAGYPGGQKEIEQKMKIARSAEIADMKGEAAPVLWHRFRRGDSEALKRLIEYNHADIEGMKKILDRVIVRLADKMRLPREVKLEFSAAARQSDIDWTQVEPALTEAASLERKADQIAKTTLDDLVFTDREPRLRVVGIDLTGSEERLSGWCALVGKEVVTAQIGADAELVSRTIAARPHVVSIDSPLSLPTGISSIDNESEIRKFGIMRYCERLLKKRGVNVYPALIPSMRRLTARGIRLAELFRSHGIPVIESYPGAAQDIMNIPRKRAGLEFLEQGLAEFGVSGEFLREPVSHDELDAITSAIVGAFFWAGRFERLGPDPLGDEALVIPELESSPHEWQTRVVIGISGPLAAGKTTAARTLERQGLVYARYSQVIEDLVISKGKASTRKALQDEGNYVHRHFGQRWLGRALTTRLPQSSAWVIDGLRFPEDHAFFSELFGPAFLHAHISTPARERWRRYVLRGGTRREFEKAEAHDVESQVLKLESLARIVFSNIDNKEHFMASIEALVNSEDSLSCRFQW